MTLSYHSSDNSNFYLLAFIVKVEVESLISQNFSSQFDYGTVKIFNNGIVSTKTY